MLITLQVQEFDCGPFVLLRWRHELKCSIDVACQPS